MAQLSVPARGRAAAICLRPNIAQPAPGRRLCRRSLPHWTAPPQHRAGWPWTCRPPEQHWPERLQRAPERRAGGHGESRAGQTGHRGAADQRRAQLSCEPVAPERSVANSPPLLLQQPQRAPAARAVVFWHHGWIGSAAPEDLRSGPQHPKLQGSPVGSPCEKRVLAASPAPCTSKPTPRVTTQWDQVTRRRRPAPAQWWIRTGWRWRARWRRLKATTPPAPWRWPAHRRDARTKNHQVRKGRPVQPR